MQHYHVDMIKEINAAIREHNRSQIKAIRKEVHLMRHPIRPQFVAQCALFMLTVIAVLACATAKGATTAQPTTRSCFPAVQWGPAPDGARPCATLKGNAPEAGAIRFTISDAGTGIVRYTGFVNTPFHHVASVKVTRLYEDGSFTWTATNVRGTTVSATVGNLQD